MKKNKTKHSLLLMEYDEDSYEAVKMTAVSAPDDTQFTALDMDQKDVICLIKMLGPLATGLTNQQFENIAEKIKLDLSVPEDATIN